MTQVWIEDKKTKSRRGCRGLRVLLDGFGIGGRARLVVIGPPNATVAIIVLLIQFAPSLFVPCLHRLGPGGQERRCAVKSLPTGSPSSAKGSFPAAADEDAKEDDG